MCAVPQPGREMVAAGYCLYGRGPLLVTIPGHGCAQQSAVPVLSKLARIRAEASDTQSQHPQAAAAPW